MASPRSSSLAFLTLAGDPLTEPPEWVACHVAVDVAPDLLTDVVLERNGAPLPLAVRQVAGVVRVVAEWPRSGPGHYELVLRCLPAAMAEQTVVTVRPAKLSERSYVQLLEDLELRLPASIAIGLQTNGALAGITLLPPAESTLEQEVLRLRLAIRGRPGRPGLASVLHRLADDPHRTLVSTDVWVPRQRARRLDASRLPQLLTRAGNLDTDGRPRRVPELRVEHTVDIYENRLVRAFHDQVRQRMRLLRNVSRAKQAAQAELAELDQELQRARRSAAFLDEVGQLVRSPSEVTMVLLKRGEYRAALEGFLDFRRASVARLDEPDLDAPLRNLPSLYEAWGVLHVIDAVLHEAPGQGFELLSEQLVVGDASRLFVRLLRDGRPALVFRGPDGSRLRVIPQRKYRRSGPLRSISHDQIPDVVLEREHSGGATDIWIFDPKYKLDSETASADAVPGGRPKKQDIDAMHAYRDAIRDQDGRRSVRYAAILYPGPSVAYSEGLAAIRAHPAADADLRRELQAVVRRCLATHRDQGPARNGAMLETT